MSEFERKFHRWLCERIPKRMPKHVPNSPRLEVPIGDDAAVLSMGGAGRLAVTTDLLSDGVDFHLEEVDPRRIGRKALAVNLSDLAAMAAEPIGVVISLALPSRHGSLLELAISLYEGVIDLAGQLNVPIIGGDTNLHDGPLVISGTAFGTCADSGPLTRAGGAPGDRLLVTGKLGGSIAGHHLDFTPRVREAQLLHRTFKLHAGIDISDGLALDASRLAAASGTGAIIDVTRLPLSDAAKILDQPVDHALGDGEDFELLLAAPPDVARQIVADQPIACGVTDIGELTSTPGLWQRDATGNQTELPPTGWLHG